MAQRSMSRTKFAAIIRRATPWLVKAEKLLKLRLSFLTRPRAGNLPVCSCTPGEGWACGIGRGSRCNTVRHYRLGCALCAPQERDLYY